MTTPALDLDTLHLDKGGHHAPEEGMCWAEAASYMAGEPFTDEPECVSPVLAAYGRTLNDRLPDDLRQMLIPFIVPSLGTADDGLDETRGYLALDWLIRTYLPAWLRLVPAHTAQADLLAAHPPIISPEVAAAIGELVRETASQASAARDAARAAAWDAADAAEAAAKAAWDAWDAARVAARVARVAEVALAPTIRDLQLSAIDLFGVLIDGRTDQ